MSDHRDRMNARMAQATAQRDLRNLVKQAAASESGAVQTAIWLPLDQVTIDQRIQVRVAGLDEEKVDQYAVVMAEGGDMPPVIVFRQPGTDELFLADGFHRLEAARRAGLAEIQAEVRPGGYDAAYEYAEQANLEHGFALSIQDKRAIFARRLTRGHEWSQLSDREVARQLGVDQKTIGNWRRSSLTEEISSVRGNEGKKSVVLTADGRVMKTGRIAQANQKRAAQKPAPKRAESEPVGTFESQGGTVVDRMMAALHEHGELTRAQLRAISGLPVEALDLTLKSLLHHERIERVQNEHTGLIYFRLPDGAPEYAENPNAVGNLDEDAPDLDTGAVRRRVINLLLAAAESLDALGETADADETRRYANSLKAEWRLEG